MKTCKDCRFYVFHSKEDKIGDVGLCRRYPPQVIEEGKAGSSIVNALGWCGEFKGQVVADPQALARALMGEQPQTLRTFGAGSPAETDQQPSGMGSLVSGAWNALGGLAKRAMGNSQFSMDTGTYDAGPTLEAAMLPMGTGAIAGVPVKAGEAVLGAGPIRAYHGSPHDFDKFDLSKIGTGEGAQAYGHGLYFADKEAIAKSYRDQLTNGVYSTKEGLFDPSSLGHLNVRVAARRGIDDGIAKAQELLQVQPQNGGMLHNDLKALLDAKARGAVPNPGHMYEVNINADPAHFLDWDKPLTQQHPIVKDAVQSAMGSNWDQFKYADAGDAVKRGFIAPGGEAATTASKLSGIPGIKYLDQGSRAAGGGSRNYVVFDDKLIDILKKYGIAAAAAPALAKQLTDANEQ